MPPTFRRATAKDADIATLHTRAWATAYRGLIPDAVLDEMSAELPQRIAVRREALEEPGTRRNWLVEARGALIGWAVIGPPRDEDVSSPATIELYAIYLEPGHVGRGYGRALMTHCLQDARAQQAQEIVMWVLEANERALRFYAAAGFTRDRRARPIPYRDTGAVQLRMSRGL